ncbi:MAG: hypothetical protein E7622_05795 [Ruminococcaceae bacterium]|nr:hypothetical protein [Oscillospiraceae bacterium]
MFITDIISITELSRLTGKSRPTIYKYINDYNAKNYDDIPFSIIELFRMSADASKADIIAYCHKTYGHFDVGCGDVEVQKIINLILENKEQIDIRKLETFILEELKNDE